MDIRMSQLGINQPRPWNDSSLCLNEDTKTKVNTNSMMLVLLEKLTALSMPWKSIIYGTQRFITMFKKAHHWPLPGARWKHPINSHPDSLTCLLKLTPPPKHKAENNSQRNFVHLNKLYLLCCANILCTVNCVWRKSINIQFHFKCTNILLMWGKIKFLTTFRLDSYTTLHQTKSHLFFKEKLYEHVAIYALRP
jgi:hypothetical protein